MRRPRAPQAPGVPPLTSCPSLPCRHRRLKCNPEQQVARTACWRFGTSTADPGRLLALATKKPAALTTINASDTASTGARWPNAAKHMWALALALPPAMHLYRTGRLAQRDAGA